MNAPAALCLAAALASGAAAQPVPTGFLNRVVTQGGKILPYQVYLPSDYPARGPLPVILFLHGSGERGTDGLLQTVGGLGQAIRAGASRYPAIVVFPQMPAGTQWVGPQAEAAMTALRQTLGEFRCDPDRVYLTGLSMGGHGTWYLAYRHPEVFAAVAPVCGWVERPNPLLESDPVVPPADGPAFPALARKLRDVPVWIFHGEMDGTVPVGASRAAAAALKENPRAKYTEFLGLGHNCWDATYASDAFTAWLFAQRRASAPR
ncbi:carboxylesterase family protein [Mesoterricola silvestris]|uniref:Phospholipase n=1 Tax=Mesoterricola silvestris TaxID=2927979 RepID=A0AA48GSA1_9BACT|nr:alpha/beta hydrolase-fold protein [Mesoterricola silvestris]BDU73335.1 phospholipase [Mesoterricola silvestris]